MSLLASSEDQIGFVFTRINELDWEQEYSITVDVSQHEYAGKREQMSFASNLDFAFIMNGY